MLPPGLVLPLLPAADTDPSWDRAAAQIQTVVELLPPRFGDACISCPAFRFCRDESHRTAAVAQLGTKAINACGSITTTRTALDLAEGRRVPDGEAETALAAALQRAIAVQRALGAHPELG